MYPVDRYDQTVPKKILAWMKNGATCERKLKRLSPHLCRVWYEVDDGLEEVLDEPVRPVAKHLEAIV